jgi:hypothetical protein
LWPLLAAFCCIFSAWTHTFVREPVVLFCCLVHAPRTTRIHCAKQTFLTLSEVEVVGNVGDIPKRSPVSSVVCGNSVTSTYLPICVQFCALEHIRNTRSLTLSQHYVWFNRSCGGQPGLQSTVSPLMSGSTWFYHVLELIVALCVCFPVTLALFRNVGTWTSTTAGRLPPTPETPSFFESSLLTSPAMRSTCRSPLDPHTC